jgi:hypothetical protein
MLKHSVLTIYHPGNMLFQTMLIISEVLLVPNILDPLVIFGTWRSHLKSLRILRLVANEQGYSESMALCCPSVA